MPGCGHAQSMLCSTDVNMHVCQLPCEKVLSCGHVCSRKCGQPCVEVAQCTAKVPHTFPCGHTTSRECCTRATSLKCATPCTQRLPCGHVCSGTCGTCNSAAAVAQHAPCTHKCNRVLPCDHPCGNRHPCTTPCPPCTRKCEAQCMHAACQKRCGDPCMPCQERCRSMHEHRGADGRVILRQCKRKCHELCPPHAKYTLKRCNEKLKCGHRCAGLQGESCPRVCVVEGCPASLDSSGEPLCDHIMAVPFTDYDDSAGDRLFMLEDCEHVFYLATLDSWLAEVRKSFGGAGGGAGAAEAEAPRPTQLRAPACPQCKRQIHRTLRFADDVRRYLSRLEAVREAMHLSHLPARLRTLLSRKPPAVAAAEDLCRQALASAAALPVAKAKARVHLALVLSAFPNVGAGAAARKGEANALLRDAAAVLQRDTSPDGKCMFARALAIAGINTVRDGAAARGKELLLAAKAVDPSGAAFGGPEMSAMLRQLRGTQGLDAIDAMIAAAAVTETVGAGGHWNSCPNGHFYVIGECGGAMEQSRCPECRATIGGGGHALAEGNRHVGGVFDNSHMGAFDRMMLANPPPGPDDEF